MGLAITSDKKKGVFPPLVLKQDLFLMYYSVTYNDNFSTIKGVILESVFKSDQVQIIKVAMFLNQTRLR